VLFPLWIARRLLPLAIVLAVVLGAGEYLARQLVGDAVKSAIRDRIGGSPHVGFGSTPLLLELLRGHLDGVSVSEAHAQLGDLPPVAFDATLDNVHLSSLTRLSGDIGQITLRARLGPRAVLELFATPACVESLAPALHADLTPASRVILAGDRIALLPPHGRAFELRLFPVALGGVLSFHPTALALDRAPVSAAALAAHVDCLRTITGLPYGLRLTQAAVLPGALDLVFASTDARFSVASRAVSATDHILG
jgi:hypothetical protein